jgi:hypothetical protein
VLSSTPRGRVRRLKQVLPGRSDQSHYEPEPPEGPIPIIKSFLFADVGWAHNQIRQSILVDRLNVGFIGREDAWGESGIPDLDLIVVPRSLFAALNPRHVERTAQGSNA